MAEFLSRDVKLFVQSVPETVFGDLETDGNNFYLALMRGATFAVPTNDKIDNVELVGTGFEFPTALRQNYWNHPVMTVGEDANVDLCALFLSRALGGTNAAPTTVGTTGKEHILLMQHADEGRQLPSFNVLTSVGYVDDSNPGADYQWAGVVCENFSLSQDAGAPPAWSVELVGSGNFVTPIPALVRADLPTEVGEETALVNKKYIHPASVDITFNDGTAIALATEGRIRSWNFQLNNNLRRDDRRPGDFFRTSNDPTSGAYVRHILRGRRNCTAQVVVSLNEVMREFLTMSNDVIVQSLKFTLKGNIIAGSAAPITNYALEITVPRSYMRTVSPNNINDDAALTLDFFPVQGTGEYVSARVVNTRATAYA